MKDNLNTKIITKAVLELSSQSKAGALIYLPLWMVITLPTGIYNSNTDFVLYNALGMLITALYRLWSTYNFEQRYEKNPNLTKVFFTAGIYLSGVHWGCIAAFILWHPELQAIELPFFISMAGVSAVSLFYFASSLPFAMGFYFIVLLPVLITGIMLGSAKGISVTLIFVIYLAGLFWVGIGFNRNYRRAFENAILADERAQQLAEISTTDGLTGLRNRHFFAEHYQQEWKRAHRQQQPISVMMIDIDHFKKVNDRHGHLVGDECLQAVAKTLAEIVQRPSDILARYGGEEFVVILSDTQQVGAMSVGKKILHAIRNLRVISDDRNIPLTVSIGIASATPQKHDNFDACLQTANDALYQAKNEGRDRLRSTNFSEQDENKETP